MKENRIKCTIDENALRASYIEVKCATIYSEHEPIILSTDEFKQDFKKRLNQGFLSEPSDMFLTFDKKTGDLTFESHIIEPTHISAAPLIRAMP